MYKAHRLQSFGLYPKLGLDTIGAKFSELQSQLAVHMVR